MDYSPSRPASMSTASFGAAGDYTPPLRNLRRMTSPAPVSPSPISRVHPPPAPLDLPEPVNPRRALLHKRSRSPLRKSHSFEGNGGSEDGSRPPSPSEEDHWGNSPASPNIGATFARVASSVMSSITKPGKLSDAEIEAQAQREREASRRQAEMILTREAVERKQVEERVLALLTGSERSHTLPPPPSAVSPMPSPRLKAKDEPGWWSAAKNRLTPTKELTASQQIVQETKAKEKDVKKQRNKSKSVDSTLLSMAGSSPQPGASPNQSHERLPEEAQSREPSVEPTRPLQPLLPPPPLRASPAMSPGSPSREQPPIYAQFNGSGALDVASTLLVIARRFEKLEKWTVGHVRALEERMSDVEKWLVDKESMAESQKPTPNGHGDNGALQDVRHEIDGIRGDIVDIRLQVSHLGKVMPSGGTVRAGSVISEEIEVTDNDDLQRHVSMKAIPTHYEPPSVTSLPLSSSVLSSRSRLPYPTGDYTSPEPSFSPPHSPEAQTPNFNRSYFNDPRAKSPADPPSSTTPTSEHFGLPVPDSDSQRSTSPTPRKRYTVALGGTSSLDQLANRYDPQSEQEMHTAYFSNGSSPSNHAKEPTIGGTPVNLSRLVSPTGSPSPPGRVRAQSAYGITSIIAASPNTDPHRVRRTRSNERLQADALKSPPPPGLFAGGKFVDPLVIRKREKEGNAIQRGTSAGPLSKGKGKLPFNDLIAFFDGAK